MGKRKLTDEQITNTAKQYAYGTDDINLQYIASIYNVSPSTISNALHYSISNCLVSENVARLIKEKAIRHDNTRRQLLGYPANKRLAKLYDDLIRVHKEKQSISSQIENINSEYVQLKFQFETYDETFSTSNEYPYTKEELEDRITLLEEKMIQIKGRK